LCGGCALAISGGKIHQSGGSRPKDQPRRFFYAVLVGEAYQIWKSQALPTGCHQGKPGATSG
jgi:hypothetical protein